MDVGRPEEPTGRAVRWPGAVPDGHTGTGVDIGSAADTDGDGTPDTVLTADGADLLVHSDLDADGLADRVLRIGADGSVHVDPVPGVETPDRAIGSARAEWPGLLGRLFGSDP
jgi:hypothetical protein